MFCPIPPACGDLSPLQPVVVLPFLSVEVSSTRHWRTSAVAASSSSGVSRGSVPWTVFRQSVHVAYAKLPSDVTHRYSPANGTGRSENCSKLGFVVTSFTRVLPVHVAPASVERAANTSRDPTVVRFAQLPIGLVTL